MAERVLTERHLNRALLARQLLLQRSKLPIPRALERVGGLQTQYAPSGYVGLWSRLDRFERGDLTRALERRSVVQGTLMRVTIHLVSAADRPVLSAGVREARRAWWLRTQGRGYDPAQLEDAAARIRARLAEGPARRDELVALLGGDAKLWSGAGLWVDLLRAPPSGTWERRRADLYVAAEDWLGPSSATEEEGLELLVRRYLGGFGPATAADLASWSGVRVTRLAPVLARLELRRFRAEDGAELLDLPRAPLPAPDTPAPVRFLPTWDATLLAHGRRTGILPERHRPRIFRNDNPSSVGTILVDGAVAGSWRYDRGRMTTELFERLSPETRREVAAEAERLAAFHA